MMKKRDTAIEIVVRYVCIYIKCLNGLNDFIEDVSPNVYNSSGNNLSVIYSTKVFEDKIRKLLSAQYIIFNT